jgi:hypothetical protein
VLVVLLLVVLLLVVLPLLVLLAVLLNCLSHCQMADELHIETEFLEDTCYLQLHLDHLVDH